VGAVSPTMVTFSIDLTSITANTVRFYSELWGHQGNQMVPVCWFGGLAQPTETNGVAALSFDVDIDWFARAKAQGPFELRNAVCQDVDTWAVIDNEPLIPIVAPSKHLAAIQDHVNSFQEVATIITDRMREGVPPAQFLNANRTQLNAAAGNLVLLHGYCSAINPWDSAKTDFENGQFFLNPSASISNDEYARKVVDWADSFNGFSAIGHSQGGSVLAHLKNYYWSGLDLFKGSGRLLQSVATPYQGNTAAGSLANIGKVFGIGCGTNVDLTVEGAALWLNGITATTRAQIFYYSVTYSQSAFIDYCNLAINLIISTYNDGTAELKYTPLPGANFEGNSQPWCHSTGMKYEAAFLDHARNAKMNTLARRS